MVTIFLAEGFEEGEFIIPTDLLRRAGIDVLTVSLADINVTGSHQIKVKADTTIDKIETCEHIVLPGGMPGSKNLKENDKLKELIRKSNNQGFLIAAICAAPIALGEAGVLNGKNATCFDGFEKFLTGATIKDCGVVVDGNIITARGLGQVFQFSFELVKYLKDETIAKSILEAIKYE